MFMYKYLHTYIYIYIYVDMYIYIYIYISINCYHALSGGGRAFAWSPPLLGKCYMNAKKYFGHKTYLDP